MTYIMPQLDSVDKYIDASVQQAQGKKQTRLIKRVSDQYADLKLFASELVEELNRIKE
jgi:hypothetical protein